MNGFVYLKVALYLSMGVVSFPLDDPEEDDTSGHLGHVYNQGGPLYFENGHHEYGEYSGYDGYENYAPHHDHEHYAYPSYKFEYGVHDPHTGDIKKQYEERDGDTVRGYYSLVEPDGSLRIVEYTADDKHGFRATVHKIGPSHHPHTPNHQPDYHYPEHHHPEYPEYHYPVQHYPEHQPHEHHNIFSPEEGLGYGYQIHEDENYPNSLSYGDYNNNGYQHHGIGGQEYDESPVRFPYANVAHPVYTLPQYAHGAIQEVAQYGPHDQPDKLDKQKRSPLKKQHVTEKPSKPVEKIQPSPSQQTINTTQKSEKETSNNHDLKNGTEKPKESIKKE